MRLRSLFVANRSLVVFRHLEIDIPRSEHGASPWLRASHRFTIRRPSQPMCLQADDVPESEKTPFTIVTGFLGAGKTTLINYILREQRQKRICVIENEYGEINIDEKLVGENVASKEDLIQMDNGCACCSIRGDLVRTLGSLVEKRKLFDCVLLETTGLADPAPIIATVKSNQWIDDNFAIDSVICLADAKHVKAHLDEIKPDGAVNEAVQQVAFSDRILLNKVDLVSAEELASIKETIASINCFATIITCEQSKVDLSKIVGISTFNVDRCVELDPALFGVDEGPQAKKPRVHDLSMVSSCGIAVEGMLDVPRFNMFMAELLQTRAADLYRTKGNWSQLWRRIALESRPQAYSRSPVRVTRNSCFRAYTNK